MHSRDLLKPLIVVDAVNSIVSLKTLPCRENRVASPPPPAKPAATESCYPTCSLLPNIERNNLMLIIMINRCRVFMPAPVVEPLLMSVAVLTEMVCACLISVTVRGVSVTAGTVFSIPGVANLSVSG